MSTQRFSLIVLLSAAAVFAQQTPEKQEKQPSNQRDRNSPAKTGAQTSASTRSTGKGTLGAADRRFVMAAIRGGRMEVELGRTAMERGSDASVKSFGDMMVKDHSDGNAQLEALAQQKGLTVPADKGKERQLSNLTGAQFDRAYAKRMIADHQKDVAEFQKEAQGATDPEVKALAQKMLPTLQMHLEHAKALPGAEETSRDRSAKPSKKATTK